MKNTLAPSVVTARDPKGLKFVSIVESAYNKAALSDEEAQRVNDTPGLADLIGNFITENRLTDKFKDEEVSSSYGYLSGYKPEQISDQLNCLRELFPDINTVDLKLATQPLPLNAEGYFLIPRWNKVAPTYGEACEKVLALLAKTRKGKFTNYREGQLGLNQLRQSARTAQAFEKLGEAQKDHDILVLPAQFGIRHRGRSVRRAREVFMTSEFGLGAFAIGIMLLTHPERLQHYDDLWIDCAGDEFAPDAGGSFSRAPFFVFFDDWLEFDASDVDRAGDCYGTASGFSPQ